MGKRLLTDEQDAYLRKVAPGRSNMECTVMINKQFGTSFTRKQIHYYKQNHKISSGKKPWEFSKQREHLLTEEQDRYLRENVKGKTVMELAEMINQEFGTKLTAAQIKTYKKNHGIVSGVNTRFKKGHLPENRGKKMSKEVYQKCSSTMFKKGNLPINTQDIGTVKKRDDGYWWCKYYDDKVPSRKNWEQIHRHMWEEANGPVPDDCFVIFKDGNRDNLELSNLMLVTKQEALIMSSKQLFKNDKELTEVGANIAKMMAMANNRKNQKRKK